MKPSNNKKTVGIAVIVMLSFCLLSGCIVQSVNPFYEKEALTDLPAVYGKWVLKKGSVKEGLNSEWTFSADKISLPETKTGASALSSRLFKIDDMLFLDAIADDPPEGLSVWWTFHVAPVHTVSRVILEDKTMKIIPLDASWMEAAVKKRTVMLPSVWHQEQNGYLFTATPAEWSAFLKKYGKDLEVFSEKEAFVFVRQ